MAFRRARLGNVQQDSEIRNRLRVRRCHFLKRLRRAAVHYVFAKRGNLPVRAETARVTEHQRIFTHRRQRHKLVGHGAAHHTHVGVHRHHVQPAAAKDVEVRLVHAGVVAVQVLLADVGAISILHRELTQPDRAGPRARLVTELCLNLIEHHRQLAVGMHVVTNETRNDLLVGHGEHQVVLGTVLEPQQIIANVVPAARLLPDFRRLHHRHNEFLAADGIHFLPQHLLDLGRHPCAEREQAVNARCKLAYVAPAHQQLVVGHVGFGGVVAKCFAK